MMKELLRWIKTLNHYGRLRVFLNEEEAKECQKSLSQIEVIIKENKALKKKIYKLELDNDSLQMQVDNPGGLL